MTRERELLHIALLKLQRWCPVEANITIDTIRDLLAEPPSPSEAVERDAARWRSMQIVMDCITAVERHQMDESQFFGAVVEAFGNAMRSGGDDGKAGR